MASDNDINPQAQSGSIYHVVVVGFHHKKGCIVEYAYPPLIEGEPHNSSLVPEEWKYLPFLALPDGAHNFTEDTTYFHLPPKKGSPGGTVYAVSCYRQIEANLLKKKDDDVTRGTVQKSVVVLSKMPMYGLLHAKLQLITHAYFEEKDFSQKHILKELYDHINISTNKVDESQRFLGLSARNLVATFKHKIVVLFKLILLERRVIFHTSPVHKLVGSLMALLSLFPRMIEAGLAECTDTPEPKKEPEKDETQQENDRLLVVTEANDKEEQDTKEDITIMGIDAEKEGQKDNGLKVVARTAEGEPYDRPIVTEGKPESADHANGEPDRNLIEAGDETMTGGAGDMQENEKTDAGDRNEAQAGEHSDEFILSSLTTETQPIINPSQVWQATSSRARDVASSITARFGSLTSSILSSVTDPYKDGELDGPLDSEMDIYDDDPFEFGNSRLEMNIDSPENSTRSPARYSTSIHSEIEANSKPSEEEVDFSTTLDVDELGFPLSIFTKGHWCLPYVALQQHDILASNIKRGFVAGATNVLFKTRQHLSDVVIDIENAEINFNDYDLRRVLHLTAADLRFADHLVENVVAKGNNDIFLDATGWEGGDEWIQSLFIEYLNGMLAISLKVCPDPRDLHDYNEFFLAAWKQTKNYRVWKQGGHKVATDGEFSHPFHGQYTVSDMKLRLHHNLQSSERGRKFEGAVANANQAVSNTGKIVGSAIISAKSSFSSWFSGKISSQK